MNRLMLISMLSAIVNLSISVDSHAVNDKAIPRESNETEARRHFPKQYEIRDSADDLMWFIQVSDLHISIFLDPTRITEFKEFCDVTIGAIKPPVVIASGDLTDSKAKDYMGSGQIREEWVHYRTVLEDSKVLNKTVWLDTRGNHDNMNVASINSKENYFAKYSAQGKEHPRSYMHQIAVGSEKYTFVAIDTCLEPGPRRPFNFIGYLSSSEADNIKKLVQQARDQGGDYIVWFGHYPTSCILSDCNGGLRSLLGKFAEGMVYLCGHLHTLSGIVTNMYTLQPGGFLELELADWRDSRVYRLAAIDHGQFSFIDIKHREWPVALITNPKHALYAMPQKENPQSILKSTHVRVLAFSLADIKSVEVQIDEGKWWECRQVKGPLYVAQWNPQEYNSGIHDIKVRVRDADEREKITSQPFSLDGTRLSFGVMSKLLLMSDLTAIFQGVFGSMVMLLVVPLCVLRFLHELCLRKKMRRPGCRIKLFHWWFRKLWILSSINRLFFPLIFYTLYLTWGPLAFGEVLDHRFGTIFAWGTWIGSSHLPGSFTYAYSFYQLLTFQLPLTLMLAHRVDKRLSMIVKPPLRLPTKLDLITRHVLFVLLITMQLTMVYFFFLAYGPVALVVGPMRTWSIILASFLWYQANRMPQSCFRGAAAVWSSRGSTKGIEEEAEVNLAQLRRNE